MPYIFYWILLFILCLSLMNTVLYLNIYQTSMQLLWAVIFNLKLVKEFEVTLLVSHFSDYFDVLYLVMQAYSKPTIRTIKKQIGIT